MQINFELIKFSRNTHCWSNHKEVSNGSSQKFIIFFNLLIQHGLIFMAAAQKCVSNDASFTYHQSQILSIKRALFFPPFNFTPKKYFKKRIMYETRKYVGK